MFLDEAALNRSRRSIYVERIRASIEAIGVIDGCDAPQLAAELVQSFEFALHHHLAEWTRVELRPQLGVGTQEWLRVRGRIAELSTVQMPGPDDEAFDILISVWYRFLISGQAPTPVLARRGDREVLTATDDEGFFDLTISALPELGDVDTFSVDLELGPQATMRAEKAVARALVPHPEAQRGLFVDLDGLILTRPANRFSQVLAEVIQGVRPRLEKPVDGAIWLLEGLAAAGVRVQPLVYFSDAPRHLYKHMQAARRYAELPLGYIHLHDYSLRLRELREAPADLRSMIMLHELVEQHPQLPFLFVGTLERAAHYEPIVKSLAHRLEGVMLIGEGERPASWDALARELGLDLHVGPAPELLQRAAERGWVDA